MKEFPKEITEFTNLEKLIIEGNAITELPKEIVNLKNLKELSLITVGMNEFPKEITELTNLEKLVVVDNDITELPEEIVNLKNLKILDLNDDLLNIFPKQIAKLENLEELYLQYNKIDDEIPKSYNDLSNLTKFLCFGNVDIRGETLENEKLAVCEYGIGNNYYSLCRHGNEKCLDETSIKTYELCESSSVSSECDKIDKTILESVTECSTNKDGKINRITIEGNRLSYYEIIPFLEELTELEYLTLRYNQIKEFPIKIANLTNLEKLTISNNNFKELPKEIVNLKNLKELSLTAVGMKEFPKEITELTNLEKLIIEGNAITELPKEIVNLKNLKELSLITVGMNEFPKEITELTNLEKLVVVDNDITELPEEIVNLKNLKILDLNDDLLKIFPKQIAKLENLEELYLQYNKIDDEIPKSYNDLSNLTKFLCFGNVDIRGETLKNEKLVVCEYGIGNNYYSLCRHGNEKCLDETSIKIYELCEDSSIILTTSKTTSKISTTIDKPTPSNTNKSYCGKVYGNCPKGYCCSKYGWCGKSSKYCSIDEGCQPEYGICSENNTTSKTTSKISTTTDKPTPSNTNKSYCGKVYGNCPKGYCCSKYGWCGKSSKYCSINEGCQPEYGICSENNTTSKTTSKISTTTDKPTPSNTNKSYCGKVYGNCPKGYCCSKYGWCGKSSKYCSIDEGCQPEYGICSENNTTSKTTSKISTTIDKPTPSNTNKSYCGKVYGNCPKGYCCSKYGWCGKSSKYCSINEGCQPEYGICSENNTTSKTTSKISTTTDKSKPSDTNKSYCGKVYGNCPKGYCCSKYGWCGKSSKYCSIDEGCQPEYGICSENNTSSEGRCGNIYGKCPSGQCCSKYGWCGKSSKHCATNEGCQSDYGLCTEDNTSIEGKCGKNYGKCPSGQCCSKYGWCGKTDDYCSNSKGCQSEFGKCN
ncbi:L domain-like protein [Anaeromyces robustus]|uniref:L domain-like protein n=1 Tax=Anaeromyces robustus TaxID=1754192 RepID=A0A1Y1X3K6_9FUNG|nr:L domain-like protein [Anaeromyces robustus]|eukprot:ORX80363.1 L domain-like protein [Anaeromyces robustus]